MNSARCIRWSLSAIALFLCIACAPPEEEAGIPCTTAYDCPSGMECGPDLYCVEIEEVTDTPTGGNDGTTPDTTADDALTDDAVTEDAATDDAVTDNEATDTAMPDTAMPDEQTPDIDTATDTETTDDQTPDTTDTTPDTADTAPDVDTATGCALNNGDCQQNCDDTGGTVTCSCNEGFALNGDGLTCACADYYAGDDITCTFCETDAQCGAACTVCEGATLHCKNNGDGTSQCVQCTDNSHCDTVAGESCNAQNICTLCPLPLTLGTKAIGETGWTRTGNWILETTSTGWMRYDDDPHKTNYDHSLTYTTDLSLAGCSAATLKFSIMLLDYVYTTDADKSEKMYVECSGDSGGNWTTLVPDPFPANQSSSRCSNCYCDGNSDTFGEKSFGWTAQSITLPVACKTATARIRFRAKGTDSWAINYWGIDAVSVE